MSDDEGADQADRHGQGRDQRRAQAAEKQIDDEHHEDEGLDQRLLHLMDRIGDENRRIVGDLPGQIVGKARLQLRELVLHRLERRDRVCSGRLVDRDRRCGRAVEAGLAIEVGGAEFQTRDVAEPQHRAVRVGADHDLLEFLRPRSAGPWSGC